MYFLLTMWRQHLQVRIPFLVPGFDSRLVYFFCPCAPYPPFPPWAARGGHEYPRLAGEATDFGCGHRSGLGRARDFWCWNDLEWTGCTRVTGHRTETTIMFFWCGTFRCQASIASDGVRRG